MDFFIHSSREIWGFIKWKGLALAGGFFLNATPMALDLTFQYFYAKNILIFVSLYYSGARERASSAPDPESGIMNQHRRRSPSRSRVTARTTYVIRPGSSPIRISLREPRPSHYDAREPPSRETRRSYDEPAPREARRSDGEPPHRGHEASRTYPHEAPRSHGGPAHSTREVPRRHATDASDSHGERTARDSRRSSGERGRSSTEWTELVLAVMSQSAERGDDEAKMLRVATQLAADLESRYGVQTTGIRLLGRFNKMLDGVFLVNNEGDVDPDNSRHVRADNRKTIDQLRDAMDEAGLLRQHARELRRMQAEQSRRGADELPERATRSRRPPRPSYDEEERDGRIRPNRSPPPQERSQRRYRR